MFFKKNKNKENITTSNEYEKAKKEFLDFYGEMSARLHSWKLISFFMLILVIISVSGVVYLSTRSSLIPYVIEVDDTGNAKGINPAYQVNYEPTEANIQYYLQNFVNKSRWISADEVLQGKFYIEAVSFLSKEMKEKFDEVVRAENWTELLKNGITRDVQIESISKVAGTQDSYQVRWTESVYKRGDFIDTKKFLAIFSIKIVQPKNLEELQTNPLGIKIIDYHMANEK
ncbi:VirB8/TrbF family protein [Fusobacterium sp. 27098_8_59]|jgi:hypothetical protein|uniref:VirB8/TrbF family protein n=1 Tax=Fusobacterium sp. 27098_8_59 TaxID=3003691 RepID=UPI00352D42DE